MRTFLNVRPVFKNGTSIQWSRWYLWSVQSHPGDGPYALAVPLVTSRSVCVDSKPVQWQQVLILISKGTEISLGKFVLEHFTPLTVDIQTGVVSTEDTVESCSAVDQNTSWFIVEIPKY